jgi:hypothetical protein
MLLVVQIVIRKVLWCQAFIPCQSIVELDSTALTAVPGQMSSSHRHVILQCFMLDFSKLLPSSGYFQTLNVTDSFWKINLDQTIAIHSNNLDCKVVIESTERLNKEHW